MFYVTHLYRVIDCSTLNRLVECWPLSWTYGWSRCWMYRLRVKHGLPSCDSWRCSVSRKSWLRKYRRSKYRDTDTPRYLVLLYLTGYIPLGRNAFHCFHRFDVLLDKLLYVTPRFVYDFCISKVDSKSVQLAYSLLELIFVRSGSFSISKDFADTDIQTMIDALCTA